jgi:hypothetical protein
MVPNRPDWYHRFVRTLFDDEHEAFRESFAQFVAKELAPDYLQWEADGAGATLTRSACTARTPPSCAHLSHNLAHIAKSMGL